MLKEIERNLKQLEVKLNGSLAVELDHNKPNKVNVYDMDIMTFEKILIGVYYKNINTVFLAHSI